MTSKLITLVIVLLLLALTKSLLIILALGALGLLLGCLTLRPRATLTALAMIPVMSLASARPGLCIVMIAAIIIVMIVVRPKPQTREVKRLLIKDT